jgi:hypothetical protein
MVSDKCRKLNWSPCLRKLAKTDRRDSEVTVHPLHSHLRLASGKGTNFMPLHAKFKVNVGKLNSRLSSSMLTIMKYRVAQLSSVLGRSP